MNLIAYTSLTTGCFRCSSFTRSSAGDDQPYQRHPRGGADGAAGAGGVLQRTERRAAGPLQYAEPASSRDIGRSAAAGGQGREFRRVEVEPDGPADRTNRRRAAPDQRAEGCARSPERSDEEGGTRVAGGVPRRGAGYAGRTTAGDGEAAFGHGAGGQPDAAGAGRLLRQPDHRAEGTLQHIAAGRRGTVSGTPLSLYC